MVRDGRDITPTLTNVLAVYSAVQALGKDLPRKLPTMGSILASFFLDLNPCKTIRLITSLRHPFHLVHYACTLEIKQKQGGGLNLLFFFVLARWQMVCQGDQSSHHGNWGLLRRKTRGVQHPHFLLPRYTDWAGVTSLLLGRLEGRTHMAPFSFFFFFLLRPHILEDGCFGGLSSGLENSDLG